jgi:hypothetical protein
LDESVGVVFTPPIAGYYDVCAAFSHFSSVTSGLAQTAFELVETAPSSQTILQEGKSRLADLNNTAAASTQASSFPQTNCGTFYFSSVSERTIRLMFEQNVSGTVNSSVLLSDRAGTAGQEDIRITVRPALYQSGRPYLVGNQVTHSSATGTNVETFSVSYGQQTQQQLVPHLHVPM